MLKMQYTATILQYVHDVSAREALNIGVLVFSREVPYIGLKCESKYSRLSEAFGYFDEEVYKSVLRQTKLAIDDLRDLYSKGLGGMFDVPSDAFSLMKLIWKDSSLSYRYTDVISGLSSDLEQTTERLFERVVTSQSSHSSDRRRNDEDVWSAFSAPMKRHRLNDVLHPKQFENDLVQLKFEHTFKNERYHILEPVSMDLVKSDAIQAKALRIAAIAAELGDIDEVSTIYVLLGKPLLAANQMAYEKAKQLLSKRIRMPHEIIEEDGVEDFAIYLEDYMQKHGVINLTDQNSNLEPSKLK